MSIIQNATKAPLLMFEFPLKKRTTKERVEKALPKGLYEHLHSIEIKKEMVIVSFYLEVFEHPDFNFETHDFKVKSCIEINGFDFEKNILPFWEKMIGKNKDNDFSGCFRMNNLTGYHILSKIEMSTLAANKYTRFFELTEFDPDKLLELWTQFLTSVENLGSHEEPYPM